MEEADPTATGGIPDLPISKDHVGVGVGLGEDDGPVDVGVSVDAVESSLDFSEDEQKNLGRANGNMFIRKEGVEGVHDGQIMVRLKKNRYIVIDYELAYKEQQSALQDDNDGTGTNLALKPRASKSLCLTSNCYKIGIPTLLFDSHPHETASLYTRSGLCFTCQRNLNEKRRTQRKRKRDSSDSFPKRLKVNGEQLKLRPDAIIINGPVDGAKAHSVDYPHEQIAQDLEGTLGVVASSSMRLFQATRPPSDNDSPQEDNPESEDTPKKSEALDLYDTLFMGLSKSIYLLSQWKVSWDLRQEGIGEGPGQEQEVKKEVEEASLVEV